MRIPNDIDLKYFDWLCAKVDGREEKERSLLSDLHNMEFTYILVMDQNRCVDGMKLRECFAREMGTPDIEQFLDGPCTMLEMLVALAERMEFILYDPENQDQEPKWFWTLIHNLGLQKIDPNDPDVERNRRHNKGVINKFLKRRYRGDGSGGLFPIKGTRNDQRNREIWYQMNEYVGSLDR